MKDESLFKPLQRKPAFFWVRSSQDQFHLRQKTQSHSHIHISEGRLLLRCLWKVGLPLQSKTGHHSHPEMLWGAWSIPQASLLKLMILYTWDGCLRESLELTKGSQATCSNLMWIARWLWSQCKGNWIHLNLIWGTPSYFAFLRWHQCSSCLVTVLLRTLWSSKKQIEAPYVFDWEKAIALHTMQGNRASSCVEGELSWVFSSCGRNLWYTLELRWGCPFKTGVCSVKSGHMSIYDGHLRNVN